jgi:hypothetical protein
VLSGRGDEVLEVARTNARELLALDLGACQRSRGPSGAVKTM